MAQLPEELISETMLRSPVKSLLRFKCLSKSLYTLIKSPSFINSHLSKSSQNFNLRKLIFSDLSRMKYLVSDVNVDLEDETLLLEKPFSFLWKRVGGNCNGLLLLYRNSPFELVVWNPSTRQYRDLPHCPFNVGNCKLIALGFGYDESIDDYKVVLIVYVYRRPEVDVKVWIFGLKTNIWRRSQNFPHLDYPIDLGGSVAIGYFTDGSLRWLFITNRNFCTIEIVAFDMRKKTFSSFPQPVPRIITSDGIQVHLHILEGCFCICYVSNSSDLYVWKKDEIDQFTWTKLFSVREEVTYHFANMKVLGYWKRGGKVLLNFSNDGMVWYDLKKESFAKVENEKVLGCSNEEDMILLDLIKNPSWNAPVACLESLVSVGI